MLHWLCSTLQTVHPPPGSVEPYIGLYRPGNIPTIDKVQIEEKNGRLHLVVIVPMGRRIPFQLNYLHRDTFEVIDTERQCHVIFMTGINHDLVHFNSTSKTDGRFDEFYVFGMHPRGKATYTRISPWISRTSTFGPLQYSTIQHRSFHVRRKIDLTASAPSVSGIHRRGKATYKRISPWISQTLRLHLDHCNIVPQNIVLFTFGGR